LKFLFAGVGVAGASAVGVAAGLGEDAVMGVEVGKALEVGVGAGLALQPGSWLIASTRVMAHINPFIFPGLLP